MYDDVNLLEYIYQSAKISQETVGRIINLKSEEDDLKRLLKEQLLNYKKIASSARTMLERRNKKIKEIGIFSQMITYMSTKLNISQKDDETNNKNIVNIICQNSKQEIDELNIKLKESNIKSKSIVNLAERFIKFEQEFLSKLNKNI